METSWRRWQDYAIVGFGVILLAVPFVFGMALDSVAAITAYAGGALLIVSGLFAASTPDSTLGAAWIPLLFGIGIFVTPWIFGFTSDPVMTGFAWIVGVLAVLTSGSELLFHSQPTPA